MQRDQRVWLCACPVWSPDSIARYAELANSDEGKPRQAVGLLMCDEMKCQSGIVFNRRGEIVGFAATSSDVATLRDVYVIFLLSLFLFRSSCGF